MSKQNCLLFLFQKPFQIAISDW